MIKHNVNGCTIFQTESGQIVFASPTYIGSVIAKNLCKEHPAIYKQIDKFLRKQGSHISNCTKLSIENIERIVIDPGFCLKYNLKSEFHE